MLKHIYRIIFLIAIFAASIWYFGQNIKESVFHIDETTVMSNTTLPIVTIRSLDHEVNLLHGYASNLEANLIRESITVLDQNQSLYADIIENESIVKKVNYEVRDTFDNSLIENGSYSALESNETGKSTKIKIDEKLEQGKEYALKITLVTAKSKKINYYTRIMLNSNYYLAEKLKFVMDFHNAILDKEKAKEVESYIEPDGSKDNTTLSYVTISSSMDLVSFGALKPEVISRVVPTIKEISSDLASIELVYYIKGTTNDGEEIYQVKEFYRVKYTPARMYLLNYERHMEAEFDINLLSLSQNEFKLGISDENNTQTYMDEGAKNLCFVRNGELWYYNLDENRAVKVFSFKQDHTDYIRDVYDEHQIQVLNINVEGNIDFIVYGYMNRGSYEGRVGIILYRYTASNDRIEELVYIPYNQPYQVLKEKIGKFSYLTYNDVYYFLLDQTIYSYNIITKGLTELASGISAKDYVFSKKQGFLVWQEKDEMGYGTGITVLHLETGKTSTISAKENQIIKLLGIIDDNIIYGVARDKDVYTSVDGEQITPLYELYIADDNCKILKTYNKKGYYIVNVSVENNVIKMERIKRSEHGFVPASEDHILNEVRQVEELIKLTKRVTDQALTEYYISLPSGFKIENLPVTTGTKITVIEKDTTLRLNESVPEEIYYVYAYGEIEGSYTRAGEAVSIADEKVGVVLNQDQQIVWSRGTRSLKALIPVEKVFADDKISSYDACIKMIKSTHISSRTKRSEVYRSQKIMEASREIGATVVNLTGASLEQMLYYVNRGIPVIAAKNSTEMVLIVGYDNSSITVIDPTTRITNKISLKSANDLFTTAGNVFISVIA